MNKTRSVLFVCTGNSCRSIMAEGLLRKALKELGKDYIVVSSAGTNIIDGYSPTRETIEVMKREGVNVSDYRSKSLTDELIMGFDLILVMAAHHMDYIVKRVPEAVSKTYLLKQYGRQDGSGAGEDLDVCDPIGASMETYKHILAEIKEEVYRIAKIL